MAERYFVDMELFHKIRFDFDIVEQRDQTYQKIKQFFVQQGISANAGKIQRINQVDVQGVTDPSFFTTIERVVEIN